LSDRLSEIESELESLYSRRIQQIGTCVEQSLEEATEQAKIRETIGRLEREQAELIRSKE
jgi:HPt (histidine-containing phosphotransfer) domain-containing protein